MTLGIVGLNTATAQDENPATRSVVVRDGDGDVLARTPLDGDRFAVGYRNSIYETLAEERYTVTADGDFRLREIAAVQLAVLEEYYGVPGAPTPAEDHDRLDWTVPPDPANTPVFTELSLAATDLGQRTLYVPGKPPLELWRLVDDDAPFIVLEIEEKS
nr:hypothetical protein [Arthrobacter roseus]